MKIDKSSIPHICEGKMVHVHMHDDRSNGGGYFEVVTKVQDYISLAKEAGSPAVCITNHGNIVNWIKRKQLIEAAGMKYIHGIEAYVTMTLDEKVRDNYHLTLIAKNEAGVHEINAMSSQSFNRKDNHYHYNPRMSMEEIMGTSDNIIILTACLGSPLWQLKKAKDPRFKDFVKFLADNKHRVYLEVQPHMEEEQRQYNKMLLKMAKKFDMNIIASNDVHALNEEHEVLRKKMKIAKKSNYADEDNFDLTAKSRTEMVKSFIKQDVLTPEEIKLALDNTLVLTDSIEEFSFERSIKYPQLYDDPEAKFKEKIQAGIKKRGINKLPIETQRGYAARIKHELQTYRETDSVNFMLLEEHVKSWAADNEMFAGYGRGSVTGSIIAYLLGITEMDSIVHDLNFERFMNKHRNNLGDIDSDWYSPDRLRIQEHLLTHEKLNCASIITIGTIGLKGAVKDIARYMEYSPVEANNITSMISDEDGSYPASLDEDHAELMETAKKVTGVCVNFGRHAAGVVVSTKDIEKEIGLMTVKNWDYAVSSLTMKEVDFLNFVKLDVLGLDNIGLINTTCKLANLPRLTPDSSDLIDFEDEKVWQSMVDSNLLVFQYEQERAGKLLRDLYSKDTIAKIKKQNPDITMIDLMSVLNAAQRPSGASYVNNLLRGEFRDNGHPALNDFFKNSLGYMVFQEQQTGFLVEFCGWTVGEADVIRRGIGKKNKQIMDEEVPKIRPSFIKTMVEKHGDTVKHATEVADSFIQVFLDSVNYGFSINHSRAYTYIGYISTWLRYYYPLEFLTAALRIWRDNQDKTVKILNYAEERGIELKSPTFRYSQGDYYMDTESNSIYQGVQPLKGCNMVAGDQLYSLKDNTYDSFVELLFDVRDGTSLINKAEGTTTSVKDIYKMSEKDVKALDKDIKQNPDNYEVVGENCAAVTKKTIEPLIRLGYFKEFGKAKKLMAVYEMVMKKYTPKNKTYAGKQAKYNMCLEFERECKDEDYKVLDTLEAELFYVGRVTKANETIPEKYAFATSVDKKRSYVRSQLFIINTGETLDVKVSNSVYKNAPFEVGDLVEIIGKEKKPKSEFINGKWSKSTTKTDWWINQLNFIKKNTMFNNKKTK